MVAPIPPMLKYSIAYNLLNFPLILIKFVSKFIVCKVHFFKAQYILRLRFPLSSMICYSYIAEPVLLPELVRHNLDMNSETVHEFLGRYIKRQFWV